jgi:hypothetical protein
MDIKWDKVGALAGVASLIIGGLAISAQVATPELRCHLGLEDKSACPPIEQPSPEKFTQSPTITPSPAPPQEKPSEVVESPSPSPQSPAERESLQEKLIGNWIYISSCEINNEPVALRQFASFNSNKTVTQLIFLTTTATSSNFFSTRQRKIEANIQVTYEWTIEEPFLYMKIVDRVASLNAVSGNGRSVELDDSSINQVEDSLERSFLRGVTSKYKVLDFEDDSVILEKVGGTPPLCESSSIVKYVRLTE